MHNAPGTPTAYQDLHSAGLVRGIGIESQDIASMVDKMVHHMLANPQLTRSASPPRVIVDSAYFENQSSQRLNKNLLIDQLATQLQIAANGRIRARFFHDGKFPEPAPRKVWKAVRGGYVEVEQRFTGQPDIDLEWMGRALAEQTMMALTEQR